jgi:hypothetical protein
MAGNVPRLAVSRPLHATKTQNEITRQHTQTQMFTAYGCKPLLQASVVDQTRTNRFGVGTWRRSRLKALKMPNKVNVSQGIKNPNKKIGERSTNRVGEYLSTCRTKNQTTNRVGVKSPEKKENNELNGRIIH